MYELVPVDCKNVIFFLIILKKYCTSEVQIFSFKCIPSELTKINFQQFLLRTHEVGARVFASLIGNTLSPS